MDAAEFVARFGAYVDANDASVFVGTACRCGPATLAGLSCAHRFLEN